MPGLAELYQLLDGSLAYYDDHFERQPWLATAVPSIDNGLWQLSPDGTMQTTWRLKPGVAWQDGTPLTSDDLQFTIAVYRERSLGLWPVRGLPLVDAVDTPDAQTLVLHWQQLFISADAFFAAGVTGLPSSMWPLPRHLLEQPLHQDPTNFLGLAYWRGGFVGVGPFKMQSWVEGTSITLVANDGYVLGRPRLDRIDVRLITDRGALIAALLSGDIQLLIGRGLFAEDVLQLQKSTQDVKVQLHGPLGLAIPVYPEFINPDPPIVANLQFRRALLMAIDRQEMTDTLNYGLGPVADSWISPDLPQGKAVDQQIVRYPYDTRAASQMIQDLGYAKASDGSFRDATGALLSIQIATHTQNSIHGPATLAVARSWKNLGVNAEPDVRSAEAAFDLQWRATYPGFFLVSRGMQVDQPDSYFSQKAIPTANNNYQGANAAHYGTAELDGLLQRYITTVPFDERMAVLGQIVHEQTDQVMLLPLFFQGSAYVLGNARLQNVLAGQVWNAHLWDLS
ncbi:MAG TPA: ABC transporter substrate-binding protein [Gemmatimonadales bacterium]